MSPPCRGSWNARGAAARNRDRNTATGHTAQDGHPADPGLDESQMELAFEYALEDWPFDLSRALSKAEIAAERRK